MLATLAAALDRPGPSDRVLAPGGRRPVGRGRFHRFFVIAAGHSLRWTEKLKRLEPQQGDRPKRYESALADAKNLRDMIEHDDAYLGGRGNKQQDYQRDVGVNEASLAIKALSVPVLVISTEGTSTGSRVSVDDTDVRHASGRDLEFAR